MLIPERLRRLETREDGAAWLAALPQRLSEIERAWDLRLGAPYAGASVSYVVPALRGAERVVLKVQWPHDECAHEADALWMWNGDGAVRLLAHDPERHALLLECCLPGSPLASAADLDR